MDEITQKIKILHVASFIGNIGDNASHKGFYNLLNEILNSFIIEKIEIRKFYKNYSKPDKMFFDEDFIRHVNKFDVCFIGGGGFLDYWVENSQTGTTIDISPEILKNLKTPTVFTSIGSNPHKKIPHNNLNKFKYFLDKAIQNKKINFAFRNDGSMDTMKKNFGVKYLDNFTEILDHGFFYESNNYHERILDKKYVAINITNDQLDMLKAKNIDLDIENYYNQLKIIVEFIVYNLKLHVVFLPHIYSDLKAITKLLDVLNDDLIRNNITVAQYMQDFKGAESLFSIYQNSEVVIGTRFHANVCSLALGKPTIGLVVLNRVKYLYDFFGIPNNAIKIDKYFSENVIQILQNLETLSEDVLNKKKQETKFFYELFFKSL